MRRVASGLVLLLAVFLVAGCTWFQTPQRHKTTASHTPVAGTSGTPTPETSASPAESPSPSPSPGATATPTSTPAPTATPYAPLVIKSLPFHGGDVGYGYRSVTAVGGGGKLPYTWSISSGSLPPGLSMSSDGVTTGTPTAVGTYGFNVHLEDAAGSAQGSGSSITINQPVSATARCSNIDVPCRVESGCADVCGAIGSQADGTGPYQYSSKGSLPAGTSLNGLYLAGTFTTPNPDYAFTITVTDDAGASASFLDHFYVYAHISIDGPFSFSYKLGNVPSGVQVAYTDQPTFFASTISTTGNPPSTPTLDQNQPYIDIAIPPQRVPATYKFSVTIGDSYPCSSTANCSTTATITITIT